MHGKTTLNMKLCFQPNTTHNLRMSIIWQLFPTWGAGLRIIYLFRSTLLKLFFVILITTHPACMPFSQGI